MNETNLNAELLSGDRRRKHIPMAVFLVILIHVVLFLVLLIAAGCRAKARARLQEKAATMEMANSGTDAPQEGAAGTETAPEIENTFPQGETELVLAREPEMQRERVSTPGPERTAQRALPSRPRGENATTAAGVTTYTVKAGDTVGKIAKEHGVTIQSIREANRLKNDLIRPGQVLRITKARQMASI